MNEEHLTTPGFNKYEDMEAIVRIQSAALTLEQMFKTFEMEIRENFNMVAGALYSENDLKKISVERRPKFVTNLMMPAVLSLVGNFKDTMPGFDFIGRTPEDHKKIPIARDTNNYVLYQANDFPYEMAKAFLWAIIARISWLKHEWNFNEDPKGMIEISHYEKFLRFDIEWNRRDLRTCKYISDEGWFSPEEMINIYAKNDDELRGIILDKSTELMGESTSKRFFKKIVTWAERMFNITFTYRGQEIGYDESSMRFDRYGDWYSQEGRFRVVDWYEKRLDRVMFVTDRATGNIYDITEHIRKPGEAGRTQDNNWFDKELIWREVQRIGLIDPKFDHIEDERIFQTSVCPALSLKLYDAPQPVQNKDYKFTRIDCYDFHPDALRTRSVIDNIAPSAKSYVLRKNTMLTSLMRQSQGGLYVERTYAKNLEELKKNEIEGITIVEDGAIRNEGFKEKTLPTIPQGLHYILDLEREDIKRTSGINDNVVGAKESQQESGKLYNARVEQANIMQQWIHENAQAAMKQAVRMNIGFIQRYIREERMLNINREFEDPYWLVLNKRHMDEFINDISYAQFDVIISTLPYGKQAKEREYEKVLMLADWIATHYGPELVPLPEIIKASGVINIQKWLQHVNMALGQQQMLLKQQQIKEEEESQMTLQNNKIQNMTQLMQNLSTVNQMANENNLNDELLNFLIRSGRQSQNLLPQTN